MSEPTFNPQALQSDLLALFEKYGIQAGVGLTRREKDNGEFVQGVAIRSQDDRLDAENIGIIEAF